MHLGKLLELPVEQRIDKFAELLGHYKDMLKNEKNLEKFVMIYPEWALEFQYIEGLKKVIADNTEKKNES